MRRLLILLLFIPLASTAQKFKWFKDNSYLRLDAGDIVQVTPGDSRKVIFADLSPEGKAALPVTDFWPSPDGSKVLIFNNDKKVWRLNTRGDYWVFDRTTGQRKQLGAGLAPSSLMFAEFSPDLTKVAYVSEYNVYCEDLATGKITPLTTDGTRRHINGTFDWAYEEEFACRDGIQWSPDSKTIAFWQIDATKIRDFYMINNTDSVYSKIVPVEYPTAGQSPSPARIGLVDVTTQATRWVPIPGDPQQHYIPRIEWSSADELFVQQLNRKQNESKLFAYTSSTNSVREVLAERDEAWIDVMTPWENAYMIDFRHKIQWINGGKEFLWFSEKDGWNHVYRIGKDGKSTLITKGDFDVMTISLADEKTNTLYFIASPLNATQKYLYKCKLDGSGKAERVSPTDQAGTHRYKIAPNGKVALHSFTNASTPEMQEWITLPNHKPLSPAQSISRKLASDSIRQLRATIKPVEFIRVSAGDGVELDGWMVKPANFDPGKKYPVLFYVYSEPAATTVNDDFGTADNFLFNGDLAEEGYICISLDNRGTPSPKGRAWRKSIYRKIGAVNIADQANAAKEILKWKFVDPERIAVWGWSGGGSATLNLMFQYPEIYKTGIAVAAVANQLTYDNIYQERFMGLPQENMLDFVKGSPLYWAKNLKGNLLYIHGTGDDNVHYANAEMLINELVKHGKLFDLMVYPNRTHSISEGAGTYEHLANTYTRYLREKCPGGGR